jgi:hypothetical protein
MTQEITSDHGTCGGCKNWYPDSVIWPLGYCSHLSEWDDEWSPGARTPRDFWCRDFSACDDAATSAPPLPTTAVSAAARDVLAERRRQIDVEGWTSEHDDAHGYGDLARAAACYALTDREWRFRIDGTLNILGLIWPWSLEWWKPTTRRRDLVKAGALILAEIERLDREEERAK